MPGPKWWLVVLLVLVGSTGVAAEDEDERGPVMFVALHRIASLTAGHYVYWEEPLGADFHVASSEPEGFPFLSEEPIYPYGSADELIELIKSAVRPTFWEDVEGAFMATMQERMLVVRATREVHADIASFLTERQRVTRPVTVRLCAVPAPPTALAAAARRPDDKPWREEDIRALGSGSLFATVLTFDGAAGTVARGMHQALVSSIDSKKKDDVDYEFELIAIGRYGLRARITPNLTPDDGALLFVQAEVASLGARNPKTDPRLDMRDDHVATWQTDARLAANTWQFIGAAAGSASWGLFARVEPGAVSRSEAGFAPIPLVMPDDTGPMVQHITPIGDLTWPARSRIASFGTLGGATFARRLEIPEPAPYWAPDNLVELIQHASGEEFWEEGSIGAYNGQLIVRNEERVHAYIHELLRVARAQSPKLIHLDTEIVEMPSAEAAADLDVPRLRKAIANRAASVRASARLSAVSGARNVATSTRMHRYVAFHSVLGKRVATPVTDEVLLGLVIEARPTLDVGGKGVVMDYLFSEQELDPASTSRTLGERRVDLPAVRVHRGQVNVRLGFDAPTIVSRSDDGRTSRFVVVTARAGR